MHWDVIVIGSGPGGLTAALALARAGKRVLVLEQHYLPGGWAHSFALDGYTFSPGVHYLGELGPGGGMRAMYEGLGVGADLEFCEMNPDGFDHVIAGGERFDIPAGFARYRARLVERFPHERAGLERYFATLQRLSADVLRCEALLTFPAVLRVPFVAPTLCRWGFRTLGALLDGTIRDPLLRAILVAQCGNHGLAPSRVSLPLHTQMAHHYHDGGFYPRGGAKRIVNAMIKALRRRGGQIRTRARVAQIRVERGRATGVALADGRVFTADAVVSNADPAVTFERLLPPDVGGRERRKARRMEYSVSAVSLFCATDLDLRGMGLDSGNYWWYRHADVDAVYERAGSALPGATVDGLFIAIPTLKDPSYRTDGRHTLEIFTFVPSAPFERWRGTTPGQRADDYERLKGELAAKMLAAAEHVVPGLSGALRYLSVGTPLTHDFYCETVRGACYGTAKTPAQVGPFSFDVGTSVAGLYQCGSSTISHGLAGASLSGLMAAQRLLGLAHWNSLLAPPDGSLRVYPSEQPELWCPSARVDVPSEEDRISKVA
jgi:all-trans-retinol 13,14-reductase